MRRWRKAEEETIEGDKQMGDGQPWGKVALELGVTEPPLLKGDPGEGDRIKRRRGHRAASGEPAADCACWWAQLRHGCDWRRSKTKQG